MHGRRRPRCLDDDDYYCVCACVHVPVFSFTMCVCSNRNKERWLSLWVLHKKIKQKFHQWQMLGLLWHGEKRKKSLLQFKVKVQSLIFLPTLKACVVRHFTFQNYTNPITFSFHTHAQCVCHEAWSRVYTSTRWARGSVESSPIERTRANVKIPKRSSRLWEVFINILIHNHDQAAALYNNFDFFLTLRLTGKLLQLWH